MSSGSSAPAVLGSCVALTLGEWALKPAARPAAFVAALILREIWPADSLNTLARGSITACSGLMASGGLHGRRAQLEHHSIRRPVGLGPSHVQPTGAVGVELRIPSALRRPEAVW